MCGSSADLKTGDNPYCNKIYKSLAGIPFVLQQVSNFNLVALNVTPENGKILLFFAAPLPVHGEGTISAV